MSFLPGVKLKEGLGDIMIDLIQYYLSILLFIALLTVVTILAIETLRSDKTSYFTNFIKKHIAIVLFISALFVSFISFDEYGISWDETASRKSGRISYEYITLNNQELIDWQDRDYGVAFELPLYILEKVLNLADPRRIYLMRHLIINTFYLISALMSTSPF